jgi:2-isopropylmalate synthase
MVDEVKEKEALGYAFDDAEASFEILARRLMDQVPAFFTIERFRVMDERRFNARGSLVLESEATISVRIGSHHRHVVALGNGPVNALDMAFRKALDSLYPELGTVRLIDYKVRILPPSVGGDGTDATTRVMIESGDDEGLIWRTVGVSTNIIDASLMALVDSMTLKLLRNGAKALV